MHKLNQLLIERFEKSKLTYRALGQMVADPAKQNKALHHRTVEQYLNGERTMPLDHAAVIAGALLKKKEAANWLKLYGEEVKRRGERNTSQWKMRILMDRLSKNYAFEIQISPSLSAILTAKGKPNKHAPVEAYDYVKDVFNEFSIRIRVFEKHKNGNIEIFIICSDYGTPDNATGYPWYPLFFLLGKKGPAALNPPKEKSAYIAYCNSKNIFPYESLILLARDEALKSPKLVHLDEASVGVQNDDLTEWMESVERASKLLEDIYHKGKAKVTEYDLQNIERCIIRLRFYSDYSKQLFEAREKLLAQIDSLIRSLPSKMCF